MLEKKKSTSSGLQFVITLDFWAGDYLNVHCCAIWWGWVANHGSPPSPRRASSVEWLSSYWRWLAIGVFRHIRYASSSIFSDQPWRIRSHRPEQLNNVINLFKNLETSSKLFSMHHLRGNQEAILHLSERPYYYILHTLFTISSWQCKNFTVKNC